MRDLIARWRSRLDARVILSLVLLGVGISLVLADVPPVVLSWETASEVGTAGFNVYRAPAWLADSEAPGTKVNPTLIPSEGDEMVGAAYRFEDEDAELVPGRRYRYQIEEVEWEGGATLYPETVVVRAGLPSRWTKLEGVGLVALAVVLAWGRFRRMARAGDDR